MLKKNPASSNVSLGPTVSKEAGIEFKTVATSVVNRDSLNPIRIQHFK
jgi:hypothetical protein